MVIDDAALTTFDRDGYVVVPGVVSEELLEAARREVQRLRAKHPPPEGHRGFHFYWHDHPALEGPLMTPFTRSAARDIASAFVVPYEIEVPDLVQIALNIPPWAHRPGGPHLDGTTPPEPDGRPSTFTMLAAVMLTDQSREDMGNLWVWPGTHRVNADYFRAEGSDALMASSPYPPTPLSAPRQVFGSAGDLLLAHYLLGHNIGGNTSDSERQILYYRLRTTNHRTHWRQCIADALFEFEPVRRLAAQALDR